MKLKGVYMKLFYSAPNIAVVCLDKINGKEASGRFYHYYSKEPLIFSTVGELVIKMDNFYDEIHFPQAGNEARTFAKPQKKDRKELTRVQNTEEMKTHAGDIATFVVHVQYRQNATWQGKIVWAEENKEIGFRSALEMLKLMDTVIESNDKK